MAEPPRLCHLFLPRLVLLSASGLLPPPPPDLLRPARRRGRLHPPPVRADATHAGRAGAPPPLRGSRRGGRAPRSGLGHRAPGPQRPCPRVLRPRPRLRLRRPGHGDARLAAGCDGGGLRLRLAGRRQSQGRRGLPRGVEGRRRGDPSGDRRRNGRAGGGPGEHEGLGEVASALWGCGLLSCGLRRPLVHAV